MLCRVDSMMVNYNTKYNTNIIQLKVSSENFTNIYKIIEGDFLQCNKSSNIHSFVQMQIILCLVVVPFPYIVIIINKCIYIISITNSQFNSINMSCDAT